MANVTLPLDHSDADLALATRIVARMGLEELHVFALPPGGPDGAPPGDQSRLERSFAAVDAFFERVADLVAPWTARQPKTGKLRRAASRSTPAWSEATTSRSFRST